jgi:hypothetical protein
MIEQYSIYSRLKNVMTGSRSENFKQKERSSLIEISEDEYWQLHQELSGD